MSRRRRQLRMGTVGEIVAPRIGPSAPDVLIEPGVNDGEIDITVVGLPADWGDAVVAEDDLGTLGTLEWFMPGTGWQLLADPAATGFSIKSVTADLWGVEASYVIRGVNAEGVAGTGTAMLVTAPGEQMELDDLTVSGDPATVLGDPATVFIPVE